MRIAVSGTHASGKTTLIEAFVARHPEYAFEPEPYAVLTEIHGDQFAHPPTVDDFQRQLAFQIETLERFGPGDNVIFERAPADFLAYMIAIGECEDSADVVREAMAHFDLIVFLPLDARAPIDVGMDEDLELRDAVDDVLRDILLDDAGPLVIEARGSVKQRLVALESALSANLHP